MMTRAHQSFWAAILDIQYEFWSERCLQVEMERGRGGWSSTDRTTFLSQDLCSTTYLLSLSTTCSAPLVLHYTGLSGHLTRRPPTTFQNVALRVCNSHRWVTSLESAYFCDQHNISVSAFLTSPTNKPASNCCLLWNPAFMAKTRSAW